MKKRVRGDEAGEKTEELKSKEKCAPSAQIMGIFVVEAVRISRKRKT